MPQTASRVDVRAALATGAWIAPHEPDRAAAGNRPAHLLRGSFARPAVGSSVVVHATAHGIYELFVNGRRVDDQHLKPGFTSYRARLAVHRFDITDLLQPGENVICILLSDGWFRGRHGFERRPDGFGTRTEALLSVLAGIGTEVVAATGAGWLSRPSHITAADLMDGQREDRGLLDPCWFVAAGITSGWKPIDLADDDLTADRSRLIAAEGPAVRTLREVVPVAITCPRPGTAVIDMGEELNGWLRLTDLGPAGTRLVLMHGEVVGGDGLVDTGHLQAFNFASGQLLPQGRSTR